MNKRKEAKNQDAGERPLPASYSPLAGQPASCRSSARYTDPRQVVEDPALSLGAKREILASWACDNRAPHDHPCSRMLDSGAVVHVREILEALKSLDGPEPSAKGDERPWPHLPYARRRRGSWDASRDRRPRKGRPEDDDDPPPCPVRSRPPGPMLPPLTAVATAPRYERMPDDALGRPMTSDTEPWQRNTVASAG